MIKKVLPELLVTTGPITTERSRWILVNSQPEIGVFLEVGVPKCLSYVFFMLSPSAQSLLYFLKIFLKFSTVAHLYPICFAQSPPSSKTIQRAQNKTLIWETQRTSFIVMSGIRNFSSSYFSLKHSSGCTYFTPNACELCTSLVFFTRLSLLWLMVISRWHTKSRISTTL
jgi:hypothetical protein